MSLHTPIDPAARSPWATLNDYRQVVLSPSPKRIDAEISIPGSKSFTNRALLIAALAKGPSRIEGILKSDDSYWCIDALKRLGVQIKIEDTVATVKGTDGVWPIRTGTLYVGSAGTVARFLPCLLAASSEGEWDLTASISMTRRPMKTLFDALVTLGAEIRYLEREGFFPIRLKAKGLTGTRVEISGATSSQYLSGLLIAASAAQNPLEITVTDNLVQPDYVAITIEMLRRFGVFIEASNDLLHFKINPTSPMGTSIVLEPDVSAACYFMALAAISGGQIRIPGLSRITNQPDIKILDILTRMGCMVSTFDTGIEILGPQSLKGGFELSMLEMSDQALTIGVLAALADGPIKIKDVKHIRAHECDRIAAITENLSRAAIQVKEHDDGFTVYPGQPKTAEFESFDDHRVAMAFALLGSVMPQMRVNDPGCVSKTFPQYFEELSRCGLKLQYRK